MIYQKEGSRINWTFDDKDEINRSYILDFSNRTYKEFTLMQHDTFEKRPIAIIADAGDDYLVIIGEKNSTITLIDKEGISHTYDYPRRPEYALISKEDYWNCMPNYRIIEDKI